MDRRCGYVKVSRPSVALALPSSARQHRESEGSSHGGSCAMLRRSLHSGFRYGVRARLRLGGHQELLDRARRVTWSHPGP